MAESLLVFRNDGVALCCEDEVLRFTPGMAMLRMKRLEAGISQPDHLLLWGDIGEGDAVLDCTLGLASDALVAAKAVGVTGRVVGLEHSVGIFAVVSEGLGKMGCFRNSCAIEALWMNFSDYLKAQTSKSFDVVVFDPMFERPRKSSFSFEILRRHALHQPLRQTDLEEARRVARRWVLVKGSRYSQDLKKLGLLPLPASRSSTVVWARVPAA